MSPSPVRPTCLGQHSSADAKNDVRGKGSSSSRSANADTDTAWDVAEVKSAGASTEKVSKRVDFTADPDEVIEIRARGKQRSAKLSSAQRHTQVQQSEVCESDGGSRLTVLHTSDECPLLSSTGRRL